MNWYWVFYWISVAEGVKGFFDIISDMFLIFSIIALAAVVILSLFTLDTSTDEEERRTAKIFRSKALKYFWKSITWTCITWSLYIFLPSKRDSIIIITGGTTLNYLQKDSVAKKIPPEIMGLLSDKIKEWRAEISSNTINSEKDTLLSKTKEELINIIRDKK